MNQQELQGAVEAILFASGDPLPVKRIAAALELPEKEVDQAVTALAETLEERQSGLVLKRLADQVQLCTRTEFSEPVRSVLAMKKNTPLSGAAFEVLAVIAYNQPVTKAFVEEVRGVDCSGVIGSLTQKGLIEEKFRMDLPGRPIAYGTTPAFLRCFCIESLEELPPLPERDVPEAETEPSDEENQGIDSNIIE
ncbi:MAG: SMC-Scp complex subunit ScpB [Clostridia bacterium]|nr:SMC-Scp complex subunit ScpB [Clostridia bacterium]